MPKRIIITMVARPEKFEKERTDKGSVCARKIRREIERLSTFELKPIGEAVEQGYIPDLDVISTHLDYEVLYNGKCIAEIDTTCSNYTFAGSQIMPVAFYKGGIIKDLSIPAFMVYSMEKENKCLADRCVWIRGENVIKPAIKHETEELGGKLQHNYYTDKVDWYRGLQSLIDELLKIVERSKQATLD